MARRLLAGPAGFGASFVKVVPTDYRLALESGAAQAGTVQIGTVQVGTGQVGAGQVGAGQEMASARG